MNIQCKCSKPADTNFGHLGPLCTECFVDILQRRTRKALKDSDWVQKNQKVFVVNNPAAEALFKGVIKDLPVEYVPVDQAELVITGKTADDEAEEFLDQLFKGKLDNKGKAVNILENITTAELEKYCELTGIVGKPAQKSGLRQKLEGLEKRYPGIIFALQKSKESMR